MAGINCKCCNGPSCDCDGVTSPGVGPSASLSSIAGLSFSADPYDVGGGVMAVLNTPSAPASIGIPAISGSACGWESAIDDYSWGSSEDGGGPGAYYSPPDTNPADGSLNLIVTMKKAGGSLYVAVWDGGRTTSGDDTAATKHLLVFYGSASISGCCDQDVTISNALTSGDVGTDFAGAGPFAGTAFIVAGYGGSMVAHLTCTPNLVGWIVNITPPSFACVSGVGFNIEKVTASELGGIFVLLPNEKASNPPGDFSRVFTLYRYVTREDTYEVSDCAALSMPALDVELIEHGITTLGNEIIGCGISTWGSGGLYSSAVPDGDPVIQSTAIFQGPRPGVDPFPVFTVGGSVTISNTNPNPYTGGSVTATPIYSDATASTAGGTFTSAGGTGSVSISVVPSARYKAWYAQVAGAINAATGTGISYYNVNSTESQPAAVDSNGNPLLGRDVSWFRITSATSGVAPYSLTYEVDANATGATRYGRIIVNGYVFVIQQAG